MVDRCPYAEITPDVTEFIQMVDYATGGTMPVLAGARDQAYSFMVGRDFFSARLAEARKMKAESEQSDG